MLDNTTRKRIDDCRDILVGKLPDPKSQIEQITIALIYKFMDDMDKESVELGGAAKFFSDYKIPDPQYPDDREKDQLVDFKKYAWDNLLSPKVTAAEMLALYSEAIERMEKNPNIPPLFRDIFKNAYLPYRDPETLKLFLKTISEFEYTHSEKLGDAFEYLLSVMGSQGDAGQFRTPRHIIDFLVAAVNPSKTDTLLDPACGTAGFLVSAFKHILNQNNHQLTPDERKKLIRNFVGYDISPDMVRLSLVNLYLHGFPDPRIWEYDTLSSEERWDESYDVILANPPFMSPKGGIRPHKKFTISSNRSEVLFVDYIAEHLNPKGRAGIIVPEGVIFQGGTAYKDLRKMLVENYLYAVVSLPAGVFNPYSGVKTSILLMDKELAKKTDQILFIKIDNDGYKLSTQRTAINGSHIEEALDVLNFFRSCIFESTNFENTKLAHAVPKTTIAVTGDWNLSGDRYKTSIKLSSNYELIPLEELVLNMHQGINTAGDNVVFEQSGYPIIQARNMTSELIDFTNLKYLSVTDWEKYKEKHKPQIGNILFSNIGTIGKSVVVDKEYDYLIHWNIFKIVIDSTKINSHYLKQCLGYLTSIGYWEQFQKGGTVKFVNKKILKDVLIPVPSLSIQEEIVAEIEGYQKIIDGAKMVVENYKPKIDINPDWKMVELGKLFEKSTKSIIPADLKVKSIKYIGLENISQGSGELVGNYISNPEEIKSTKTVFGPTNILYGKLRPNLNKVYYSKIEGICSTDIFVLKANKIIEPKFYASYFLSEKFNVEVMKGLKGAQLPRVGFEYFSQIIIPFPPIEIQNQIVAQIEKEQALINANKELIQIFEQKIKDRIAKVWGTSVATTDIEQEESLAMPAETEVEYSEA